MAAHFSLLKIVTISLKLGFVGFFILFFGLLNSLFILAP